MFSSRRLAKRSIIGTRVSCPRQDGRYYPGIIHSIDTTFNGEERYTVRYDDGFQRAVTEQDIVGPGFQNITSARIKNGQKIYLTHNGREVAGLVISHDYLNDEVLITFKLPNGHDHEVIRKLDDIRLLESRKSARLQDQDQDYSRLADFHTENKKRAVSHVIDVPIPAAKLSRRRKCSPEPEEPMTLEEDSSDSREDEEMEMMDEHMAAMVLTSLSTSPVSPKFPINFSEQVSVSPGVSSSFGSSGVFTKSESSTPSPPQHMSASAPCAPVFGSTPPIDEGIELDDTHAYFMDESSPKKKKVPTATLR